MSVILCFDNPIFDALPPCPHTVVDEDGYCLTCDRPVE